MLIVAKAFTLFFYLANISEQVFRETFVTTKKSTSVKSKHTTYKFSPVFTAHPTESARQSTLNKIYKKLDISAVEINPKACIKLKNNILSVKFRDSFKPRRGRINCSLNDNGKWRWFGTQFVVMKD